MSILISKLPKRNTKRLLLRNVGFPHNYSKKSSYILTPIKCQFLQDLSKKRLLTAIEFLNHKVNTKIGVTIVERSSSFKKLQHKTKTKCTPYMHYGGAAAISAGLYLFNFLFNGKDRNSYNLAIKKGDNVEKILQENQYKDVRGITFESGSVKTIPNFRTYIRLESLDISHNHITGKIPAFMMYLKYLSTLNMSYTNFTGFPESIDCIESLVNLDLSHNPITSDFKLPKLNNLLKLNLSHTRIAGVPKALFSKTLMLAEFNISNNNIHFLDLNCIKFRNLRVLDVSNCNISSIDIDVFCLPLIETINLNSNKISTLPKFLIRHSTPVTKLKLGNNRFKTFPSEIFKMKKLEHLDLSENKIKVVPEQIVELVALNVLILSKCEISEIQFNPYTMPKLSVLDLSYNPNCSLNIGSAQESVLYKDLRLSHNDYAELPTFVTKIVFLQKLDLSGNSITLKENFLLLLHLCELKISNCGLTVFPELLMDSRNLKYLDISCNQIPNVVRSIVYNLKSIVELNISSVAGLCSFEEAFIRFPNLKSLNISNNDIKCIPDFFECMLEIQVFVGQNIGLIEVSESLFKAPKIKKIDIKNNNISNDSEELIKKFVESRGLEVSYLSSHVDLWHHS